MGTERLGGATRYHGGSIALHWLIAVLIGAAFILGEIMTDIPGLTPTKLKYFSWHKWLGMTVFFLLWLRVVWKLTHPAPAMPAGMPRWQVIMAHAVHGLLYLLMITVPLSGWLYSSAAGVPVVYLGVLPLPDLIAADPALKDSLKLVHNVQTKVMLVLVLAHIGAALKHQFIDRDGLLSRMLPGRG